jgi:hypothetical protein
MTVPAGKSHSPSHHHVVFSRLGDVAEARKQAVVVQDHVKLDRSFGLLVVSPVKQARTKLDHRCIDRQQRVFEPKAMLRCDLPAALVQLLENTLVELPWPVSIGVRQGGLVRRLFHPQMVQLPFCRGQALADLAQRLRFAKLAEQHRRELVPTSEPSGVPFRLRLLHQLRELTPRKQLENLSEHAGKCVQRRASCRLIVSSSELTKSTAPGVLP